eukprot:CAMPEP_0185255630 /NCGR_PEP_ID=MMETSP1359-20130426/4718_1 /TAXON_ID=552665 /ORGANISM="Bigelowiella longifila, Strain CCMP242" /LENGTH=104 /DNA_ID=CAMNT_0027839725 /DNA_START=61 /DNA_END=375 /DNA_ORIENTATION=+
MINGDKPWLFRKMDALTSTSSRKAAIRVAIEDWIRWKQYSAHTTASQRESEIQFTSVADGVDNVIDGPCYASYNELTYCIMNKNVGSCKDIKLSLDKCVRENYK